MTEFINLLSHIGAYMIPLAFLLYFPFRWLEYYMGGRQVHAVLNVLWYIALALSYTGGITSLSVTVPLLFYLLALDTVFWVMEQKQLKERTDERAWESDLEEEYDYDTRPGEKFEDETSSE